MAMPYVIFTDLETGQAYNSFYSYGLILSEQEVGVPPVKTKTIDIEGAQGSIDMTEAFDEIFYKDRTLTFTFSIVTDKLNWTAIRTKMGNELHGRRVEIQIYDDMGKYYVGRCFVDKYQSSRTLGTIVMKCTCEPFKYAIDNKSFSLGSGDMQTIERSIEYEAHSIVFYFDTQEATGNTTIVINKIPFIISEGLSEVLFPIKFRPKLGEPIEIIVKGIGSVKLRIIQRYI